MTPREVKKAIAELLRDRGFSYKEIAQRLDIGMNRVAQLLRRTP